MQYRYAVGETVLFHHFEGDLGRYPVVVRAVLDDGKYVIGMPNSALIREVESFSVSPIGRSSFGHRAPNIGHPSPRSPVSR